MKTLYLIAILLFLSVVVLLYLSFSGLNRDKTISFVAPSLKNHILGETSKRKIKVYLPPNYENEDIHYPVIYFLHGFTANYKQFDEWEIKKILDNAINTGRLQPLIFVMPDSDSEYLGSFYAGVWSDYIGKDVVNLIDSLYRTIPTQESRGIAGHSMGGNGALKVALAHPGTFSSIYAMSPSVLQWDSDFTPENKSFELISQAETKDDIISDFYSSVIVAMGRSYTPNNKAKFGADIPFYYLDNKRITDSSILQKWEAEFPIEIIRNNPERLKGIQAIAIDCGDKDPYSHIPGASKKLHDELKKMGINCSYELYEGDHSSGVAGPDGRISVQMIDFFTKHLKY